MGESKHPHILTFPFLTELAGALARYPDRIASILPDASFTDLGPALALMRILRFRKGFTIDQFDRLPVGRAVLGVLEMGAFERQGLDTSPSPFPVELTWLPSDDEQRGDEKWRSFCNRLTAAARRAGFGSRLSAAMTGAFRELASNAEEHSMRVESAIGGYTFSASSFEFCISDLGIGILSSLRTCSQHADLKDHAAAIEAALTPGVSRFPPATGRGFGFKPIFECLSQLRGDLRVHSGDHAIEVGGTPNGCERRVLRQTFEWDGVHIAFKCKP
jgi:hypothetical protein